MLLRFSRGARIYSKRAGDKTLVGEGVRPSVRPSVSLVIRPTTICLSVCPVSPFVRPIIHLSVFLVARLTDSPSVLLDRMVRQSAVRPSMTIWSSRPSVILYRMVHPSVRSPARPSVRLSFRPSFRPFVRPSVGSIKPPRAGSSVVVPYRTGVWRASGRGGRSSSPPPPPGQGISVTRLPDITP